MATTIMSQIMAMFFAWPFFFALSLIMAWSAEMAVGNYDGTWHDARATFYGDMGGGQTMGGACGYGDLFAQGYGLETAALSTSLFHKGLACGSCYEIRCVNSPQWCIPNGSVKVTATNFCPPNYDPKPDNWCNPPQKHFDLSMAMFVRLADYKAGIIPVQYRRIPCSKQGGVKFQMTGNPYWILVLMYNVGGGGDVARAFIKGSNTSWITMSRNWGQNWQVGGASLVGQSLSFKLMLVDGSKLQFDNVADANWQFQKTYDGKINF